jgi:hypothetical protein
MKIRTHLFAALASVAGLLGFTATAHATVYTYSGVVTLCTPTCDSFASLAVGTEVTGQVEIDTSPNGTWTFADVNPSFGYEVFNPAAPTIPFDGTNPTVANPLPLNELIAPIRETGLTFTTGGTTDANNDLDSGFILHEFVVPPFSSNGAWVIFDLSTGIAQVCVFFTSTGCIPGATQVAVIEGDFTPAAIPVPAAAWLFGSALLGLMGLRRRRA